jgi:hypothetical protein
VLPAIPRPAPRSFPAPEPTSTMTPGSNALNAVDRPQPWAGLHSLIRRRHITRRLIPIQIQAGARSRGQARSMSTPSAPVSPPDRSFSRIMIYHRISDFPE